MSAERREGECPVTVMRTEMTSTSKLIYDDAGWVGCG